VDITPYEIIRCMSVTFWTSAARPISSRAILMLSASTMQFLHPDPSTLITIFIFLPTLFAQGCAALFYDFFEYSHFAGYFVRVHKLNCSNSRIFRCIRRSKAPVLCPFRLDRISPLQDRAFRIRGSLERILREISLQVLGPLPCHIHCAGKSLYICRTQCKANSLSPDTTSLTYPSPLFLRNC